jgi:hypothetical protein
VEEGTERNSAPKIWYVEKTNMGWGDPVYTGDLVNAEGFSGSAHMTDSGTLYFSGVRGTENADVYLSRRKDGVFQEPEKLPEPINSRHYDSRSYIAPDENLAVIYRINREGARNVRDLLIFFRQKDGSWSEPKSLKRGLGLKGTDLLGARLSPDGKYLFVLDDMDIYWIKAGVMDKFR